MRRKKKGRRGKRKKKRKQPWLQSNPGFVPEMVVLYVSKTGEKTKRLV
jgi:hypothetical protein